MSKKAQITIILIIAIFIILITGISVYYYISAQEKMPIPEIKAVAEGAKPVSNYVSACLKLTAEEGLNLLGSQGGFLDVSSLRTDIIVPTNGEAVSMDREGRTVIPYWYHLVSDNKCEKQENCVFVSQIPSLKAIEKNLKKYILENLDSCLKDFQGLKNFEITPKGGNEVNIYTTEDKVRVLLKYPFKIKTETQEFAADEFLADVDLDLKKIIGLAQELTQLEMDNRYLESHAINLLSLYSDIDSNKLPPFGKTDISFKGRMWAKSALKKKIKEELLAPNMQFLRIAYLNTNTGANKLQKIRIDAELEEMDEETVDALLNRGMIIPLDRDYTSLHTAFSYLPWWDVYFDLNCKEEICGPQGVGINYLAIFGIQRYQFAYDLSYPVLVEITDPKAMNNRGYVFKFLLETNIRDNEQLKSETKALPVFDLQDARTLLCELPSSGEFIFNVVNRAEPNQPIDGAAANLICGNEKCMIGEVGGGVLRAMLPRCLNSRIEIIKSGFHPAVIGLDTFTDQKKTLDIELEPYRSIDVKISKYQLLKSSEQGGWTFSSQAVPFGDKEEAVITLNKKVSSGEPGYTMLANLIGSEATRTEPCSDEPKKEASTIELVPGDYNVNIVVLSYDNITIPAERRETGSWPFTEKFTVPEMVFNCENPLPISQISFDWHVEAKDISPDKMLNFYSIAADFKETPESWRKLEDISAIAETQNHAQTYQSLIRPQWRKK